MHHFDAISQKISGGGPPDPHLREGVTPSPHPPPFGASRLSEAFGFIGPLCPPPGSGGSGSAPEIISILNRDISNFNRDISIKIRDISIYSEIEISLFK